jgi:hypothetical protein
VENNGLTFRVRKMPWAAVLNYREGYCHTVRPGSMCIFPRPIS